MLRRYENEISEPEEKIEILKIANRANLEPKLNYAMMLISNIDRYILEAPVETKIKLIGSIFDEKIEFDGESYRTNSYNKVLELIYTQTKELRGLKNENRGADDTVPRLRTQSRGRTGTGVNLLVFETSASTDSAIWAAIVKLVCKCRHFFLFRK